MDSDRIKEMLHAWRPGDNVEAGVERAREAASVDPELARWLARERAFDQAFSDKLRQVGAPADLLGRILESVEAELQPAAPEPVSFPFWRRHLMGLAASLILVTAIFTLGVYQGTRNSDAQHIDLAGFVSFSVKEAMSQPMRSVSDTQAALSELAAEKVPVPEHLPAALGQFRPVTVSTITVNGSRASVIGFEGDAGYRLMVFNRSCVGARCKRLSQPIMYDLGDRMAVAWIDGKQVYVLVADRRGEATIRQIHEI